MSAVSDTHFLLTPRFKVVAAGICALILTVGVARFAYTPFLPLMLSQTGLSTFEGGWLATVNYLGYLCGVLLISLLQRLDFKFFFYRINLLVAVLSTLIMGMTTDIVLWSLSRFIAGVSSTAGIILAAGFVMTWLKQNGHKSQLGLHFAGLGLGIAIPGLLIVLMNDAFDWARQWQLMALFAVLFFIPAWLWMPAPGNANTRQDLEQKPPSRQWMWLMIAAYSLAGVGYVVSATFVVAILEAMPLLQGKGDWAWVLLGVTAIPSCIFWDKIASRFGETRALIASYVVMLIGIIVPALSTGLMLNLLGAALYGATFAGVVSQMLVYIGHQFPLNPAKAMAKLTIGYGVAQIVAPLIAGYISTHTGSYIGALWFAGGAMVLGIACLSKIHRLSN